MLRSLVGSEMCIRDSPRPARSLAGAGLERNRDLLARHPAPGHAHHHPADHQPIHLDAQRLVADLGDGGLGSDVSGAIVWTLELSLHRDADNGSGDLLGDVDWAGVDSGADGAALRKGVFEP